MNVSGTATRRRSVASHLWISRPVHLIAQHVTARPLPAKAKIITGYAVYGAQAHNQHDADLILEVTYTNMAALDNLAERSDAINEKLEGNLDKQNQGYADRESIREILGSEYVRELILK